MKITEFNEKIGIGTGDSDPVSTLGVLGNMAFPGVTNLKQSLDLKTYILTQPTPLILHK